MKIVAFAGSNSSTSINRELVKSALGYFQDCDINFLDINDFEMPIFSVDREKNGYPDQAHAFRKAMEESDAIIVSMAEHNRSYTVAFKNILDWCSRIDMNIFHEKPMLLMSTSTGAFAAGNVMGLAKAMFPRCHAKVVTTFSLPTFEENFKDGKITDSLLLKEFETQIELFKKECNPEVFED